MSTLLRQMPLAVFLFFTALPLLAAGGVLMAIFRARRQATLLGATPTSNIGMATDGYREFEGRAEAAGGRQLAAPLTGAACVWYHARVEKWTLRSRDADSGHWSTIRDATSSAPFLLRDSTGVCAVYPWGAEMTPSDKSQWYGDGEVPTDRNPPRLDPLESSQPIVEGNARYKYFEERIYADSPLLVLGEFTQGRFGAAQDDEDEDDLGDGEESDVPSDGETDAWASDEPYDRLQALAQEVTRASILRGTGKQPFIVSTKLQAIHIATAEMGSQAALPLAAALCGVSALMLWARFG
jgi:hypothetical protein